MTLAAEIKWLKNKNKQFISGVQTWAGRLKCRCNLNHGVLCLLFCRATVEELPCSRCDGDCDLCFPHFIVFLCLVKLSDYRTLSSALWIARRPKGDNNSRRFGCSLHHTLSLAFGSSPVPHQILNLLSVSSSCTVVRSRRLRGNTFHSWRVAAADGRNSAVVGGGTRCGCSYKCEEMCSSFVAGFSRYRASHKNNKRNAQIIVFSHQHDLGI